MTRAERQLMRRRLQRDRRAYNAQLQQQRAAQKRKRRQRRNITAHGLAGATRFSDDTVLSNPVAVIELLRRWAPATCLELIRGTTPEREPGVAGANRMEGSWGLVFLAHILTGVPDWQRWYDDWQNSDLWRVCGFPQVPSWQTVYLRFAELEGDRYVAAFERAANNCIRVCARQVPHAFDFVHTDGTAAHSHARLEHACPNQAYCDSRQGRVAKTIERASDGTVNEDRHEHSAAPEPEDPDAPPDNRLYRFTDEEAQQLGLADWRHSAYYRFGPRGHIMRCRDKEVGIRKYDAGPRGKKKVWVGSYFMPAVSDYFWAPFAVHFFKADIQEHLGWPALHRKAMTALNDDPDHPTHRITGVVADRAFTNKTFIGFNTHEGIASITPTRGLPGGRDWSQLRDPDGRWDEHGPRCKYCGGPSAPARGAGEGFAITGSGDPRISYRCAIGWTQDCKTKLQTISCKKEPRALLPIGRREKVFHDLLNAHSHFEGVFDAWRDRYGVSGTSNATRSKRRASIKAQKLRAAAALLAEWFRICLRQGYVGNYARLNKNQPKERNGGAKGLIKVREHRSRHGLDLPIGPAAIALGLPATHAPPPT